MKSHRIVGPHSTAFTKINFDCPASSYIPPLFKNYWGKSLHAPMNNKRWGPKLQFVRRGAELTESLIPISFDLMPKYAFLAHNRYIFPAPAHLL